MRIEKDSDIGGDYKSHSREKKNTNTIMTPEQFTAAYEAFRF